MSIKTAFGLIVFMMVCAGVVHATPTVKFTGEVTYRECVGTCRAIIYLPRGTVRLWRGTRLKVGSETYRTTIRVTKRGTKTRVSLPVAADPPKGGRLPLVAYGPKSGVKVTVFTITKKSQDKQVKPAGDTKPKPAPTVSPKPTATPTPQAKPTPKLTPTPERERVAPLKPGKTTAHRQQKQQYQFAKYTQPVRFNPNSWEAPASAPVYEATIDTRELDRAERESRFPKPEYVNDLLERQLRRYPQGYDDREVIKLFCPYQDRVPPVTQRDKNQLPVAIARPQECNPILRRAISRKQEWERKRQEYAARYPGEVLLMLELGEEKLVCQFDPQRPSKCTEQAKKIQQR